MKKYILGVVLLAFQMNSFAQTHYKIRLDPIIQNNTNKSCYNVQLATADVSQLNLAGQNYRMYYDAANLKYANSQLLLPEAEYANFEIKNLVGQGSTQGLGQLPFEEKVGLLSISVDLEDPKTIGTVLDAEGTWLSTCRVCFDKISSNSDEELASIIWARPTLTAKYATAYVEVSEWVKENSTIPAIPEQYEDMVASTTATSSQNWDIKPLLYPNPIKDHLWIKQVAEAETAVLIYNIHGQQVYQGNIEKGDTAPMLNLSHFATGIYQVRLIKDGKQHVQFIEKQ